MDSVLLMPRHLEAVQVAGAVQEEFRTGRELRQMGLVEPDDLLLDAGSVHDHALDDLEVPPPRRPHADARELAAHRRLLPHGEVGKARGLVPVQVGPRDVLDEVADGLDPERGEPLGDLRADSRKRLHRPPVDFHPPRLRRTSVHASKAGQRGARTHGEGQDAPTIGSPPDGSYTRAVSESRKIVTIVFTDVTGSTALGEQLDPEAMRRVMDRYFAEMRTVLERHGGTVEKFIGDAVMAVFGIPVVHEDDALRALRAASEMRERLAALNSELSAERGVTIAVRTGVNTGEVVAGDPGQGQAFATGDAVNVAARLEQAAAPGQILIGPQTHRLVREAVRAEAVAPLDLKGKAEPVEAWRLVEVLPYAPAFSRRIDAPFVGRERELAALRTAYERVRDERSCELVTVTGAPGIDRKSVV